MSSYLQLLCSFQRVGYDDDGGGGGAGAGAGAGAGGGGGGGAGAGAGAGGGGGAGSNEDLIPRAEMDTHLAGMRRKYEGQIDEHKSTQRQLADELKKAREAKGLSDEERGEYDIRIKQLEDNYLSEKEKLERKSNHQKTQYEEQIDTLTSERDTATTMYRDEVVRNQIYAGSAEHEGADPDQFDAILSRWIQWEDNLVDGEPDGTTRPVVNFPDVDKDDKPVTMKYTIGETIKRMREILKHKNLFKPNLKPGFGSGPNAGNPKAIDAVKLAKENPAEYRRLRKEQPELLYGSLKGRK